MCIANSSGSGKGPRILVGQAMHGWQNQSTKSKLLGAGATKVGALKNSARREKELPKNSISYQQR